MTASLGGTTLKNPYEYPKQALPDTIVQSRSQNGTLKTSYAAIKYKHSLKWRGLTASQRNDIKTKSEIFTSQTWIDPEGGSYTVVVCAGSYREVPNFYYHGTLYDVSLELLDA